MLNTIRSAGESVPLPMSTAESRIRNTSSPKVLFIVNAFPPIVGGSANVYASLCRELGQDAVVLAPRMTYTDGREIPGWQEWDAEQAYTVHRLDLLRPPQRPKPSTLLHSAWRWWHEDRRVERQVTAFAAQLIARYNIGVVCAGEIYPFSGIAGALAEQLGIPTLFYIHGEELTCIPSGRRYRRNALRAMHSASALIAVSSFTRDELVDNYGVNPAQVHTILNGVDLGRFSPGVKSAQLVERHGLAGKRVLLTVGRLIARKGHATVVRALPEIAKRFPEIVYLIVGQGDERTRLEQLARELGVSPYVCFAGGAPDHALADYYRSCDLFVMPNRTLPDGDTEGFGLVFLEAGACGKPVVAGRAGGVPDAVTDRRNGLLVDGSSEHEVAAAILRLLQDQSLTASLGAAGLQRARASSWQEKALEFRRVCQQAAKVDPPCEM